MPVPRPLRPRSPADAHHDGRKTARRQRVRHTALSSGISSPTEIANIFLWADFSDISTLFQDTARTVAITADGETIAGITDLSGAGNHMSQGTAASEPTYKTNIQNGKSICRFDGSDDRIGITTPPAADTSWTVIAVVKKTGAIAAANDTAMSLAHAAGANHQLICNSAESASNWLVYNGAFNNVGGDPTAWTIIVQRINSAASCDVYMSGGTPTNINPADTVTTQVTDVMLGDQSAGGGNAGDYDFGEVIAYNDALTAANLNLIGNYLSSKWNITWTTVT